MLRVLVTTLIIAVVGLACSAPPSLIEPASEAPDGVPSPEPRPAGTQAATAQEAGPTCWLESSLRRVYPTTASKPDATLEILAARNERLAFQVCVRNELTKPVHAEISVKGPDELRILVRRVGYVPMPHHTTDTEASELEGVGHIPGFVPDPHLPEQAVVAGPLETHAFWVTVTVPKDVKPGVRDLAVTVLTDKKIRTDLTARVDVRELVIQPRRDFPATHWFYADSLCDWYKVQPFEEKFWQILEPYIRNSVEHGLNVQHTPLFTPPTDGVKRPVQLVRVTTPSEGKYEFDFTDVKRWTDLATRCGMEYFEWSHFFTQWGVQNAIRVYRSNQDPSSLLWPPETGATSDMYRNFLAQFLPEFHKFLVDEKLLERSFFHVSDEPHGDAHLENYRKARAMLKELAPWMKVMDAISDVRFAQQGLTDMPIAGLAAARDFTQADVPAWVYFCCGPRGRYLNRFLDTPLVKIRMSGWLFYALKARGFLHWGHNYWYKFQTQQLIDPFVETCGLNWPGLSYGDTMVVYPGKEGPIDSIRWEQFGQSFQDYALLQSAGVKPDDLLLAGIKGYDDFPKTEEWLAAARKKILLAQ